jgi:deazaflavin-dependent oxidoreductase (nitroreductase family)
MDDTIRRALGHGHVIDITTTGRLTGRPRRIEIVFHVFDGRIFISGMPRAGRVRAWLRNLEADPHLTFHLKAIVEADLAATARIITEPAERRDILEKVARVWRRDPEEMIADSPLIEVSIEGHSANRAA